MLGLQVAALCAVPPVARALPPPEPPKSAPSSTPAPVVGPILPYGSTLFFVLDDTVSSRSTPAGTVVRMHLQKPLVINNVMLAPAGAPGTLTVISTRKPQSGDVDGAVQVHLDPLTLPDRHLTLPIHAIHEYLTIEMSGSRQATRATTDTIGDIFIPYHVLYHALRPGRQMVLPVGSVLRAQTSATLDASNPALPVISTPAPFTSTFDTPHADLTPAPLFTPAPERPRPLPKGKPTLPPSPSPSPIPSTIPSPSSSPTTLPSQAPGVPASAMPGASIPPSAAPSASK